MATSSFDQHFIVSDRDSIAQLRKDIDNPRKIAIKERDYEKDREEGIALLKQKLSNLQT